MMSDAALILTTWTGEAFAPRPGMHARRAAEQFGAGEMVLVEAINERSGKSHRHYFAMIKDMWMTLPERYAQDEIAISPDHLRRHALIRTGFCDTQTIVCTSAAEAHRWALALRPIDPYAIAVPKGSTVVRYTAQSQSMKAMGAKEFQRSKTATLEWIEGLLQGAAA